MLLVAGVSVILMHVFLDSHNTYVYYLSTQKEVPQPPDLLLFLQSGLKIESKTIFETI